MRIWPCLALVGLGWPLLAQPAPEEFSDGPWTAAYQSALRDVVTHRLLAGYPDCTLRPMQIATRYEWAAVLSRLARFYDLPRTRQWVRPPDVPWNHWCAGACAWNAAVGLDIGPRGGPLFGDRPLRRSDFARTCWALMRALQGQCPPPASVTDVWDHQGVVSSTLRRIGILLPYRDGELHLDRPMLRWQMCVGVHRLVQWNKEHNGPRLYGPELYGKTQDVRRQ